MFFILFIILIHLLLFNIYKTNLFLFSRTYFSKIIVSLFFFSTKKNSITLLWNALPTLYFEGLFTSGHSNAYGYKFIYLKYNIFLHFVAINTLPELYLNWTSWDLWRLQIADVIANIQTRIFRDRSQIFEYFNTNYSPSLFDKLNKMRSH